MAESPYSLGSRCLAEFIGMIMVIFIGEASLANELLPSTKGHAMGWGWTVYTFGMAFMIPLQIFSSVSAKLNPAMCLAQWIIGTLDGVDFICLSLSEIAGAFCGACLLYLHFLPHFKTLPEPPPDDPEDELLRRRDYMAANAMKIASYNTRLDRKVGQNTRKKFLDDFTYYTRNTTERDPSVVAASKVLDDYVHVADPAQHAVDVISAHNDDDDGASAAASQKGRRLRPLARHSVQVADLQRHLQQLHVQNVVRRKRCLNCHVDSDDGGDHDHAGGEGGEDAPVVLKPRSSSMPSSGSAGHPNGGGAAAAPAPQAAAPAADPASANQAKKAPPVHKSKSMLKMSSMRKVMFNMGDKDGPPSKAVTQVHKRTSALYEAAMEADRNAKLSIFATRPAISSPFWNFYCEMSGTAALLLTALLIELSVRFLQPEYQKGFQIYVQSFLISQAIVVLIAGLGGPTAYAANTARDLGPRMAHFLLPIPNKGPSEFIYGWIPALAPLVGGAIAGALYWPIEELICPGGGAQFPKVCGSAPTTQA